MAKIPEEGQSHHRDNIIIGKANFYGEQINLTREPPKIIISNF